MEMRVLALLLLAGVVVADLPNHCLHSQVAGQWVLYKSAPTLTAAQAHQQCAKGGLTGQSWNIDSSLTQVVTLSSPNVVVDHNNKEAAPGHWTMIYDEGFEITTSTNKFFAFSKYRYTQADTMTQIFNAVVGGNSVANICDKTLPGTYHGHGVGVESGWGCYIGVQVPQGRDLEKDGVPSVTEDLFQFPIASGSRKRNQFDEDRGAAAAASKAAAASSMLLQTSNLMEVMADTVSTVNAGDQPWTAKLYDEATQNSIFNMWKSGGLAAKDPLPKPDTTANANTKPAAAPAAAPASAPNANPAPNALTPAVPEAKPAAAPAAKSLEQEPAPKAALAQTATQTAAAQTIPDALDWRNVNGVDYVRKDVGRQDDKFGGYGCGSCYAFAANAAFESRIRVKSGNKHQPSLSVLDVVSCSPYSQGCDGGFPYLTGKHYEDFGVLEEECSPYQLSKYYRSSLSISDFLMGQQDACQDSNAGLFSSCSKSKRWYATNYHYVGGNYGACNEHAMLEELQNGPIVVGFRAGSSLMSYYSGVWRPGTSEREGAAHSDVGGHREWEEVNHAVMIVGYGVEDNTKYWICKNSWGPSWGDNGYFKIVRGQDAAGIESLVTAVDPVLEGH